MASVRAISISGEKFKKLWDESLLSIDAFALKLGMGRSRVFQMTRPGTHSILRNKFSVAAERLGLTPEQLMERIGANGAGEQKPDVEILWGRLFAAAQTVAAATKKTRLQILTEAVRRESMPSKMKLVAKPMGPRGPQP